MHVPERSFGMIFPENSYLVEAKVLYSDSNFYPDSGLPHAIPAIQIFRDCYCITTDIFGELNGNIGRDDIQKVNSCFDFWANHYITRWAEQEGQCSRIVDLFKREKMHDAYAVRTTIEKIVHSYFIDVSKDTVNFFLPKLKDREVLYSTDGEHTHSVFFNDLDKAAEFYDQVMRILFDYSREMISERQKQTLLVIPLPQNLNGHKRVRVNNEEKLDDIIKIWPEIPHYIFKPGNYTVQVMY